MLSDSTHCKADLLTQISTLWAVTKKTSPNCYNWEVNACTEIGTCLRQYGVCMYVCMHMFVYTYDSVVLQVQVDVYTPSQVPLWSKLLLFAVLLQHLGEILVSV